MRKYLSTSTLVWLFHSAQGCFDWCNRVCALLKTQPGQQRHPPTHTRLHNVTTFQVYFCPYICNMPMFYGILKGKNFLTTLLVSIKLFTCMLEWADLHVNSCAIPLHCYNEISDTIQKYRTAHLHNRAVQWYTIFISCNSEDAQWLRSHCPTSHTARKSSRGSPTTSVGAVRSPQAKNSKKITITAW